MKKRKHRGAPLARLSHPWPALEDFTPAYCRAVRIACGIHPSYFCAQAQVSQDTLLRWELGEWRSVDRGWVRRVREALRRMALPVAIGFAEKLQAGVDHESGILPKRARPGDFSRREF